MSAVTSTNALAKDSTLQDVADAIETMSATSIGNMAALQTTDKSSLVGAVNELKSGLTNLGGLAFWNISPDNTRMTNASGQVDVPNPSGKASIALLNNTLSTSDGIIVMTVENITTSTITFRVRFLSDGAAYASKSFPARLIIVSW